MLDFYLIGFIPFTLCLHFLLYSVISYYIAFCRNHHSHTTSLRRAATNRCPLTAQRIMGWTKTATILLMMNLRLGNPFHPGLKVAMMTRCFTVVIHLVYLNPCRFCCCCVLFCFFKFIPCHHQNLFLLFSNFLLCLGHKLQQIIMKQYFNPPDLDSFFGPIELPRLENIFYKSKPRYFKRTSSAVWHSPPVGSK